MSYAVVKNLENAFYVVPKKWLTTIDNDGKQYTSYPATKLKKCVKDMIDVQDDWLTEEIKIVFNDCTDLKEAQDFINLKCSYSNSEASELDRKRKKPKKKLENPQQNDGENFNKMFDEERAISSQKNMKLENSNGDQTVPTNQNFGYSSPGVPFQRSLSFHSNDNSQNNSMLTENISLDNPRFQDQLFYNGNGAQMSNSSSARVQFDNSSSYVGNNIDFNSPLHHNKSFTNINLPSTSQSSAKAMSYVGNGNNNIMIKRHVIEQLIQEVDTLKRNQELIIQAINNISTMMRCEFSVMKGMINSQRNCELDITYKPQVISSVKELNDMEEKLELMHESFIGEYKKMHNYYTASVTLPNKGFGLQNGYIHSLMSMYLEREFAKSFAWASTKQKLGFDVYKNHIKFFKSICNKIEIGAGQLVFKNLTEVENSLQKFFKSIHQKPRALKLNTKPIGTTDVEENNERANELL